MHGRVSAQTPGGPTTEPCAARQQGLRVLGGIMGQTTTCRRQGRVASRRVVPPRRLRRHQPAMEPDWVIRFYNQRGTAEQHIKEGKQAINGTRLSCKGMAQNEVRLQLHALAYNLVVFLQGTDLPEEMAGWSLTSLQTRLIEIGARVVRHARSITF
ncbi:transposase [Tropicimonas sp. TH_r6]|uniref:transposase n=1 Tax=Tropicimonas sp. TH_r6 TaxID=3082085 RepID=UPI0039860E18